MKKITVCFLLLMAFSLTEIMAQSLDLKGTYKGQTIKAKGRYRPDGSVEITSLSYAPYDRLDGEVKTLKNQKQALENEKKQLERRVKELESGGGNGADLQKRITRLSNSLDSLNRVISIKDLELKSKTDEIANLKGQMQDSIDAYRNGVGSTDVTTISRQMLDSTRALRSLRIVIRDKDKEIARLKATGRGLNSNSLALEMGFGHSKMKNALTSQDFWKHSFSPMVQLMASYTYYFSKQSPFAIKVGLGYSMYGDRIYSEGMLDTIRGLTDVDGDKYDARYSYSAVNEKVSLGYIEMPIALHVGNSNNGSTIQAWFEIGLKLGVNVTSSFEGSGLYTCEGYYPGWNATIRNVESLGFVTDAPLYGSSTEIEVSKFVLWGTLAAGVNIPLTHKIALSLGANCGYTILPVAKGETASSRASFGRPNLVSGEATRVLTLGGRLGVVINL